MLTALAIANYRSLRDVVIPLQRLNVVTGANGSGKSSLYRALRLLADTAQGRVVSSLAREGGLQSTLWAGPESISRAMRRGEHPVQGTRRAHAVNLRLGFAGDEYGYLIDLGLPPPASSAFSLDPQIKRECIWHGPIFRPSTMLVADLGAAIQTIREIGAEDLLDAAVEDAFPGSHLSVVNVGGRFCLTMAQRGLLRPLGTAELSDGTVRYLLWIAALLTPRPPSLMILNEPETSLHPDLLAALARLIARASERTQVVVVTHAQPVVSVLMEQAGCHSIVLEKKFGETEIAGSKGLGVPAWHWPSR